MTAPSLPPTGRVTRWPRMAVAAAALLILAARPAQAQWSVTPYVWASSIDADVSVSGRPVVDEHIPFSDLIEGVDLALMLRAEAQYGSFGGMVDLFHVDMSTAGTALQVPGGVPASLDTDIGMTVLDVTGSYAPQAGGRGFALIAGARVLAQKTTLDLSVLTSPTTADTQRSESKDVLVDAIVGARYRTRLTRHWGVDVRADIGAGGTKLTWSAGAELAYAFGSSQRFALSTGYRYLSIEYRDKAPVQASMAMSGFVTGLRIAL